MKNENGNLNQAKSNEAKAARDFLELIILGKNNVLKEFSDKQMIQNLTYIQSSNTVRKVRTLLENENVIEMHRVSSHGEKFYKIKDYEKAIILFNQNRNLYVWNRKHDPKIVFTPFKIIHKPPKNIDSYYCMRLTLSSQNERIWFYPKIDYKKGNCPICHENLYKSKLERLSEHDMNRKCTNCKCEFRYQSTQYEKISEKEHKENREHIIVDTLGNDISNYLINK